jgi:hypothetical protein
VPYVNQYDVTANPLGDFFTSKPDFTTYTVEPSDKHIFDPSQAMKRYNRDIDWHKIMQGPAMDDPDDMRMQHYRK